MLPTEAQNQQAQVLKLTPQHFPKATHAVLFLEAQRKVKGLPRFSAVPLERRVGPCALSTKRRTQHTKKAVNDKLPLHQNNEISNFNKTFRLRQTKNLKREFKCSGYFKTKNSKRPIKRTGYFKTKDKITEQLPQGPT